MKEIVSSGVCRESLTPAMSKTSQNKKQFKIEYIDFVQQLRQTTTIKPPDRGPYRFISDQLNLVDH